MQNARVLRIIIQAELQALASYLFNCKLFLSLALLLCFSNTAISQVVKKNDREYIFEKAQDLAIDDSEQAANYIESNLSEPIDLSLIHI